MIENYVKNVIERKIWEKANPEYKKIRTAIRRLLVKSLTAHITQNQVRAMEFAGRLL